ncbi:MAG: hypothetical protein AAF514_09035 [Verrucomicrobiota bacterium]
MPGRSRTKNRIRRIREEIATLVVEFEQSGQTAAEFAESKGIVLSTVQRWLRWKREGSLAPERPTVPLFAEVQGTTGFPPQENGFDADFELVLGETFEPRLKGLRVKKGFEEADLRKLLQALSPASL